ncbi:cell division protein FtsQ/DivIB [Alicyclobacillus contaminans]|uniref:cell division protein FtsQ/DivIB n=1 Tax=Alicyclobacillus contaminans TaxID=392016 RepID=UPI00068498B3|nr:FtsQ-type POTRA domain-containing protein [Alicyclobacillus contaminans]
MNHGTERRSAALKRAGKTRTRALVFGFFLFLGVVMVLESPLTRVRTTVVGGNTSVTASDVINASGLHRGMSLWQVSGSAISNRVLAALPRIQSVTVHTDYLRGTVTLTVKEKQIVAVLPVNGKYYELLSDGKVYADAASTNGFPWPLLTADEPVSAHPGEVPLPAMATACQQLSQLSQAQANEISEIHLSADGVATVYLLNLFAAQCQLSNLADTLRDVDQAVSYFKSKGYAPGMIDMTLGQPYRYTPFPTTGQGKG